MSPNATKTPADMASEAPFREIGRGFCGSVWAVDGEGEDSKYAMKREDGGSERSVLIDSAMHERIWQSFSACRSKIPQSHFNIPDRHELFLESDKEWWDLRKARFPAHFKHCNTLISEHILPFDQKVREKLVERYCPVRIQQKVLLSRREEDCLVRPYLGRRSVEKHASPFFGLRNRPLFVNQMEDLLLPVRDYAQKMADALAIMYWHARVDANDVEFVLAPRGLHRSSRVWQSHVLGDHTLWLLDFDCVQNMSHDQAGVEQAAAAYLRNDAYFPRPDPQYATLVGPPESRLSRELWLIFKDRFLESSAKILGPSELPTYFIGRVEWMCQQHQRRMQEQRDHSSLERSVEQDDWHKTHSQQAQEFTVYSDEQN